MGSTFILLKIPTRIPSTCSAVKFVLIIVRIIQKGLREIHISCFYILAWKENMQHKLHGTEYCERLIYACSCLSMFIIISCFGLVVNQVDSHIV
jgi:hypothetical protein